MMSLGGRRGMLRLPIRKWRLLEHELRLRGVELSRFDRARIAWTNGWFTLACRLQASQYRAAHPAADPTFICGFWRSGTTLLHELLAADPRFGFARTDQCMNPALLTMKSPLRASGVTRRPMDEMLVRADSPQEDEFALLSLGIPSFYEILLAPRGWRERVERLDFGRASSAMIDEWLGGFASFLGLLAVSDARMPLLKSPTHSFRMDVLARRFPASKFVFLVREPLANFRSNLRLWCTMFELYGLEPYDRAELPALVGALYRLMLERVRAAVAVLDESRLVVIDYQDLIDDPLPQLECVYRRFGWPWDTRTANLLAARVLAEQDYPGRNREAATDITPHDLEGIRECHARLCDALRPYRLSRSS